MSTKHSGRVARGKDLRDGRSLWADSATQHVRLDKPSGSDDVEIVIIGGGISGALTALALAASGHEVAVIDRRQPGEGSTIASTALIQFEIDTPLIRLADQIGAARAKRAYLRSAKAVRDLGGLIAEHGLDAEWIERDALYLAGNEMGFRGLATEADARRAIGLDSTFLSKAEVADRFGIEATGAIISSGAAELDPARTTASCLRTAQKLGATIFAPCDVVAVKSVGRRVHIELKSGEYFTCRKAVFATGYEVVNGIPRDAFDIVSSWAIATKPIPAASYWPSRCLIWEASDPYIYIRATRDNRILVGGEDSGLEDPARRAAAVPAKSRTLLRKLSKLLQRDDLEIDYAWGGAFAESPTGLPVFKELPDLRGVYAMLGCGGNGITFSVIGAQIVKAWVRGSADADADLFRGR